MTDDNTAEKPWGGRFTESTDAFVEAFTASIGFDQRLYRHDIAGSIAHARMLAHVGIISETEGADIVAGLQGILADIERGDFFLVRGTRGYPHEHRGAAHRTHR